MSDQSEISYSDGQVVWVKLGSCWWPGEVVGSDGIPPDVLKSFRKAPIAIVKFFQEDTFEYVRNHKSIYPYQCSKKDEFIKKGLDMYRAKHGLLEKFPDDVVKAETLTDGDEDILSREEFKEVKKESYAGLFGEPKTPSSAKRGRGTKSKADIPEHISTPKIKRGNSEYKATILVQETKSTGDKTNLCASASTSKETSNSPELVPRAPGRAPPLTPSTQDSGSYKCHACPFSTSRLNVMIMHNKTHSASFTPYTPSPVSKKPAVKSYTKSPLKSSKVVKESKTPKAPKPSKDKNTKVKKRNADKAITSPVKKLKTDEEIKSSLLADWDDEWGDEGHQEAVESPEIPKSTNSPNIPVSAEAESADVTDSANKNDFELTSEKLEATDSKYEFCEDEDWSLEADHGRKIPRVKNPCKLRNDIQAFNLDDEEMAKEVDELLEKTAVPELPSAPEPLKIEENFPEVSIVKSPDKEKTVEVIEKISPKKLEETPVKTIFKTKTFFRSRHSRSQDAIEKYVAEQLNSTEKMDSLDCDMNGSDVVTASSEARDSPPIEPVKVARLAPKIQLKMMKAEAAQLKEKGILTSSYFESHNDITLNELAIPMLKTDANNEQKVLPDNEVIEDNSPDIPNSYLSEDSEKILENNNLNSESHLHKKQLNKNTCNEISNNKTTDKDDKLEETKFVETENDLKNIENKEENFEVVSLAQDHLLHPQSNVSDDIQYTNAATKDTSLPDILFEDEQLEVCSENGSQMKCESNEDICKEVLETDNKSFCERSTDLDTEKVLYPEDFISEKENVTDVVENVEKTVTEYRSDEVKDDIIVNNNEINICSEIEPTDNKICMSDNTTEPTKVELVITEDCLEKEISCNDENDIQQIENIAVQPSEEVEMYIDEGKAKNEAELTNNNTEQDNSFIEHVQMETETTDGDYVCEEVISKDNVEVNPCISEDNIVKEVVTEGIVGDSEGQVDENTIEETPQDYNIRTESEHESVNYLPKVPTESDIQMAEALMNLPSTHKQLPIIESATTQITNQISAQTDSKTALTINDALNLSDENMHASTFNDIALVRFETEEEKCENLNAAQSLVEMSEQISEQIPETIEKVSDIKPTVNDSSLINNVMCKGNTIIECNKDKLTGTNLHSSKLLQILEEPRAAKNISTQGAMTLPYREKIINNEGKISTKTTRSANHPVTLIRRNVSNKRLINKIEESPQQKIILPQSKSSSDGPKVQTYTRIQGSSNTQNNADTKLIQQQTYSKAKSLKNAPTKVLHKLKPNQTSMLGMKKEPKLLNSLCNEDEIFDINSMPIVLSDDIVTPENIDQMPIVMSDGNLLTNSPPPLIAKPKTIIKPVEKVPPLVKISNTQNKPQMKTILLNSSPEVSRANTPNILSKSAKSKGGKRMEMVLVDKATGKQKVIIAKQERLDPVKPLTPYSPKPAKPEKILVLPSTPNRKILISPNTAQTHVLIASNTSEALNLAESKPISAKMFPVATDSRSASSGGKLVVITNAQGAKSTYVLPPAHEKILFPKKYPPKSQLQSQTHRQIAVTTVQKQVISPITKVSAPQAVMPRPQLKTIAKQRSPIITSKGQLIVPNRVNTSVSVASKSALMDIMPTLSQRRVVPDTKKLKKTPNEPIIFLTTKDGAVRQLTKEQFQQLQITGVVPKEVSTSQVTSTVIAPPTPVREKKIVIQKSVTIKPANEPSASSNQRIQKPKSNDSLKSSHESLILHRKVKQDVNLVPSAPPSFNLQNPPAPTAIPPPTTNKSLLINNIKPQTTTNSFSELDNFEELLPSTAIARQPDTILQVETNSSAAQTVDESNANLQNILAVPGEHFGGLVGTFYLCVESEGAYMPVNNRPLILKENQLVPVEDEQPASVINEQPERRDILEAALANSDVFHAEQPLDEAPDFRDLNANVSVHSRVSETSTTLNQPIMTPVEVPSKCENDATVVSSLEDGLAVIGVTPHSVPTSLELPITVTDPRIAPKTSDPLSGTTYGPPLLHSPNIDMYVDAEQTIQSGPINMPLLNDEEEGIGKSMPILTDDVSEKTASSTLDSPSSLEVREADMDEGSHWPRRLLTPGSDSSETSAEIPYQPTLQLSATDLNGN